MKLLNDVLLTTEI